MVALSINLADVGERPLSKTSAVFLSAPAYRASVIVNGRIVTTTPYPVDVVNGLATVTVEPGELVVEIRSGLADSKPKRVTVPDVPEVTLQELLDSAFEYAPPVVSLVKRYRDEAEAAAELSVQTAAGIQDVAADAVQVALDRIAVESAAGVVAADRQAVTEARGIVVEAQVDVEQAKADVLQAQAAIEVTAEGVDYALETYGAQFIADRQAAQQAVADATAQAGRSEDAEGVATSKAGDAATSALEAKGYRDEAQGAVAGVVSIDGKTGVVTKAQLGIDQVDNTRDIDKQMSMPQVAWVQTEIGDNLDSFATGVSQLIADKADLDVTGKILAAQIPAVALTDFLGAVGTQAAMLALTGERGDWCTRTDRGTDWQLIAEPSTTLANWREKTYPASPVSSVNGRTGAVDTSSADITDATTVGKALIRAVDAAAGRTAIGAGTSSLTLGATSITALRGDAQQYGTVLPGSGAFTGAVFHVTEA